MHSTPTGGRWATYGIGLAFGLAAGSVGVGQWALTIADLTERLRQFHAEQQQYPGFFDETSVDRGNFWFWVYLALVVGIAMLMIMALTAFIASYVTRRRQDGLIAGWIGAVLNGMIYVAATIMALALSPEPIMTREVLPCELVFGFVFFAAAFPCLIAAASFGSDLATRRTTHALL